MIRALPVSRTLPLGFLSGIEMRDMAVAAEFASGLPLGAISQADKPTLVQKLASLAGALALAVPHPDQHTWPSSDPVRLGKAIKQLIAAHANRRLAPDGSVINPAASRHPLVARLREVVTSADEFAKFLEQSTLLTVSDARREFVKSSPDVMSGALQQFLYKIGATIEKIDTLIDCATCPIPGRFDRDSLDASMLSSLLFELCPEDPSLNAQQQQQQQQQQFGAAGSSSNAMRVVMLNPSAEDGLEPEEKRERSQMRMDADSLCKQPGTQDLLMSLQKLIKQGDAERAMSQVAESSNDELKRLLLSGGDVGKALAGTSPEISNAIEALRSTLDRRIERAVRGEKTDSSALFVAASRLVRTGGWDKLKLYHLLDKADTGTKADPLKSFAASSEPRVELANAFRELSFTLAVAVPEKAADGMQFLNKLQSMLQVEIKNGTKWSAISDFYRSTMLKISEQAKRFALDEGGAPGPRFDLKWLTEGSPAKEALQDAHLVALARGSGDLDAGLAAAGKGRSAAGGADELAKLQRQLQQTERERDNLKRKAANADPNNGGGGGGGGGSRKGKPSGQPARVKSEAELKKSFPKRQPVPKMSSDEMKQFISDNPDAGGKKACWHFFKNAAAGGCPWAPGDCTFHH